ncbi:MAG: hypothetical protein H0U27_02905 [Nitrosopumilus sp.]|nr:hypothetical protein [Nitrosopumilus sp.]
MKNKIILLLVLTFYSCLNNPKIPIPNTLELALRERYSEYVQLLNKAHARDTLALNAFLKIDYIHDSAGYDHGYILFQLIKVVGDDQFANVLKKIDCKTVEKVARYVEVGIDASDKDRKDLLQNYPKVTTILHLR